MKLLLENWRNFVKQEVENYLPHGTVKSVEIIGSSNLSPEEQKQQDKEKYGFIQKNRDIDVEVQISGITSEESEEWAFSDEAQELEDLHNYDVQLRIVENWKGFISEDYEPVTTLRIFDFDETIAHTRSETRVKAPDGSEASLTNQKEFEDYMRAAASKEGIQTFDPVRDLQELGYDIDLSDFLSVKQPEEIKIVTDILRQFPKNSKTYILTARRGGAISPIIDYLDEIGIDTASNDVRVMATQGESKGDVMVAMMKNKIMSNKKSNIDRIEYYEDSEKNISDVLDKVCSNPEIDELKPDNFELVVYKVINSGDGYMFDKITC